MIVGDDIGLPSGWATCELGSFTEVLGGSTPSRNNPNYFGGNIVWLTPTEIPKESVTVLTNSREHLTPEGFRESSVRLIPEGSVLLTSRASIGYAAIAGTSLTTNQGFASFVLPREFEPKYLAWWFKSQKQRLEELAGGTTFKEISKATLKSLPVPIAPAQEQRRIVEAIEQQFTRLDAGVAALKRAQAALKRYRAAVLKAAVEGKLTEAWRAAHPDIEPASRLLERILAERRAKWEADLRAKGKDPSKTRYVEPQRADTTDLPELPEGWCWISLEQVSDPTRTITYGVIKLGEHVEGGIPTLRSSNIRHLRLELTGLKSIAPTIANEYSRTFLRGDELLITVRGTLGGVVVVPSTCEGFNISREVAMVPCLKQVSSSCIALFVGSPNIQHWLLKNAKGIAYTGINIETLKETPVPLPPVVEQYRIVAYVEQQLSVLTELEATVEHNLKRAERLRQSILERAFSGQLVPQDPNDEPASVLLERIRQKEIGVTHLNPGISGSSPVHAGNQARQGHLWSDG